MVDVDIGITDELLVDKPATGVGVPKVVNKGVEPLARPMP